VNLDIEILELLREPGCRLEYGIVDTTSPLKVFVAGSTTSTTCKTLVAVKVGDFVGVLLKEGDQLVLGAVGGGVAVSEGSYTPTLTGMAIGTGGGATNTADWTFVGGPNVGDVGLMHIDWELIFGASGATFPTTPTIALPAGFNFVETSTAALPHGRVFLSDNNTAANSRYAEIGPTSVSTWRVTLGGISAGTSALTTTTPFTWAGGDSMRGSLRFRAVRV
jgi:hypothetical protein